MNSLLTFALGTMVSVPVSIFANVMTPRWQTFRSKRSEHASRKNKERSQAYDKMSTWFARHPSQLIAYLIRSLTSLIVPMLSVAFGIAISVLVAIIVQVNPDKRNWVGYGFVIAGCMMISIGLVVIASTLLRVSRLFASVATWGSWPAKASLQPLNDPRAEAEVDEQLAEPTEENLPPQA